MSSTRSHARADLASLFDRDLDGELEEMTKIWWSEETQTVLRAVVEKLRRKK
jgi:hypothetical protein